MKIIPSGVAGYDPILQAGIAGGSGQSFTLEKGQKYMITITAAATPQTTGYCVVSGVGIDSAPVRYLTTDLLNGNSLTFYLIPAFNGQFSFRPVMGASNQYPDISFETVIGTVTDDDTDDTSEGDKELEADKKDDKDDNANSGEQPSGEQSDNASTKDNTETNNSDGSGSSTEEKTPENPTDESSGGNNPVTPETPAAP